MTLDWICLELFPRFYREGTLALFCINPLLLNSGWLPNRGQKQYKNPCQDFDYWLPKRG